MIIFDRIDVKKFRNVKKATLDNLKDLNILIGPNNCGKTSILEFLDFLSGVTCTIGYAYNCPKCERLRSQSRSHGIQRSLDPKDSYMKATPRNGDVEVRFLLNREVVDRLVPRMYDKQAAYVKTADCPETRDEIVLTNTDHTLSGMHFSPFIHPDILNEVKPTLYCPEARLQTYKDKPLSDYLRDRKLSGAAMRRLIDLVERIVDPRIEDYRDVDLIRRMDGSNLTVRIAEQGSGVRSLICIAADILAADKERIILIDEPELGLNPLAKQEFLKFLLQLAEEKQIFLATQDPDFVNPVLWSDHIDKIVLFLFSPQEEEFVRIDTNQSKVNPELFAGYLPHTTSLKNIHVYVEGPSDVYIYQVFLRRRLEFSRKLELSCFRQRLGLEEKRGMQPTPKDKRSFEIENRIGIFHLCGDLWRHLLYTIPKRPYRCVVILDGDKESQIEKIVARQNSPETNCARFGIARSAREVKSMLQKGEEHPVYCLKKKNIEEYLFNGHPPPADYDKKLDGPIAAELLGTLPEELYDLFSAITDPDSPYWFERPILEQTGVPIRGKERRAGK